MIMACSPEFEEPVGPNQQHQSNSIRFLLLLLSEVIAAASMKKRLSPARHESKDLSDVGTLPGFGGSKVSPSALERAKSDPLGPF